MENDPISRKGEGESDGVAVYRYRGSDRPGSVAWRSASARIRGTAVVLRVIWLGLLVGVLGTAWAVDWTSPLGDLKQAAKQKAVGSADVWLNRALELQREDAQAERAMGPEAQQQAQAARAAFEAYQEGSAEPLEVYNPHDFTAAKRQIERYRRVAESIKGRTVLTPEEVRELGDALLPFLRYIYRSPDGTTGIDGTVVDLAPGQKATVQLKGFCLDRGTPAPRSGECLQLVRASRLVPEELLPLYRALLRYRAEGHPESSSLIQNLLWGIRHAKDVHPHLTRLNAQQRALLDAAMPGGADLFQRYLDKIQARKLVRDQGRALFIALAKAIETTLGERMPEPRSDGFAPTETERLLGQLTRLPVEGTPHEGSEYSMPLPGVAVKAVGVASLSPVRLEIINTTSADVSFDTSEFVGQSVRVTQRVALGGPNDSGAGVAQRLVEVLRLLELEPLKNMQALLQRTLDAYGNRADATNLDRAAIEVATLLNQFLFPVSVLDIVPMASQAGRLCKALGKGASRLNALERGVGLLAKETRSSVVNALATGRNQAVFWSGIGRAGTPGYEAAMQWATKNGGSTLESIMAARGLRLPAWDPKNPAVVVAWERASADFAAGASGHVRVLQTDAVGVSSIWGRIEFKCLVANPNVSSITAVNPETGAQILLWSR